MGASLVGSTGSLDALADRLTKIRLGPLYRSLADKAEDLAAAAFTRRSDAYGTKWAPRNGAFEQRRSGYSSSFKATTTSDGFRIGSGFIGARLLTQGGVVRPKKAKRLKIPMAGGGFIYVPQVTIPARGVIPTSADAGTWTAPLMRLIYDWGGEILK